MTLETFQARLDAQGRRCACCGGDVPRGQNWHVDHDHETGAVRGILCVPCNTGIGGLGDTIEGVNNARFYLDPTLPRVDEHW